MKEEVQVASRLSGNTAQTLRRATVAGLGITLLPSTITRLDLQAGLLVPVLPQYKRVGHTPSSASMGTMRAAGTAQKRGLLATLNNFSRSAWLKA